MCTRVFGVTVLSGGAALTLLVTCTPTHPHLLCCAAQRIRMQPDNREAHLSCAAGVHAHMPQSCASVSSCVRATAHAPIWRGE